MLGFIKRFLGDNNDKYIAEYRSVVDRINALEPKMQGLTDDAGYWHAKEHIMTSAFNKKFLTFKPGTSLRPGHVLYPDSIFYGNNTATANLLPLAFGIVPDSIKKEVVKKQQTEPCAVARLCNES